jgi:hypothetical protein
MSSLRGEARIGFLYRFARQFRFCRGDGGHRPFHDRSGADFDFSLTVRRPGVGVDRRRCPARPAGSVGGDLSCRTGAAVRAVPLSWILQRDPSRWPARAPEWRSDPNGHVMEIIAMPYVSEPQGQQSSGLASPHQFKSMNISQRCRAVLIFWQMIERVVQCEFRITAIFYP